MGIWKSTKQYFKKQKEIYRSVTEKDVIAMALANDNKITVASLAMHTELNNMQAYRKLYAMQSKGILKTKSYYEGYQHHTYFKVKHPELFGDLPKAKVNQALHTTSEKTLTDAEVIDYAVKAKGRLIPGVLCIHAKISIDAAKAKLQELQHKGVFDIEATPEGGLIYLLNDYQTYQQLMPAEEEEFEDA